MRSNDMGFMKMSASFSCFWKELSRWLAWFRVCVLSSTEDFYLGIIVGRKNVNEMDFAERVEGM